MSERLVRTDIEVPGTPEEVWRAIATGPGIACWFVPAEVDERLGGEIVTHHGPYGDSRQRVEEPLVAGVVERALDELVLVRDDDGFVEAYAHGTHLILRGYRFGEAGADVAAREERAWRAWMEEHSRAPAR